VLVGAGDIAVCGTPGAEATAALLDTIIGTVFTLGDHAYFSGTREEFRDCYQPTWGRHHWRTHPTPGNHDYAGPEGAMPYFDYFGPKAGPAGAGYYSFTIGSWHAISLNSNIAASASSAQGQWLRRDLAANNATCTIAYWHHPVFSSGPGGNHAHMREIWRMLYEADADVVLSGHDHLYERFAPQDPSGSADAARGIRQFVVGTGGAPLYQFSAAQPQSEVRISTLGVLKLTLGPRSYAWDFIPVSGAADSGAGSCH
jgi:acid phosphatase type 7